MSAGDRPEPADPPEGDDMGDDLIFLDGALGTELSRWGVDTSPPLWSARSLGEDADAVTEIHLDALRAGAQVLTACTFRTHERILARAGWGGRSAELNARAIRAAREALAQEPARQALVAGSVGPLEDCFRPDLVPSREELRAEHGLHARSLRAAGADLALVETMGTRREASAAVTAAVASGLPAWCSFVTAGPGRLLSGEPLRDAVAAVEDLGAEAVLLNCIPTAAALPDLESLLGCATVRAGIYPNVGHARGVEGWRRELMLTPEDFALRMEAFADLGATILGGCCGTQPEHVAATVAALARARA